MAAVVALEHTRMRPGEVAAALLAWMQAVLPGTADRIAPTRMCPECCGDEPRRRLEQALAALPHWARPHLYTVIFSIDGRFIARTSPNPRASPEWPWWQQRRRMFPGS
ncbi:hypothetical protein HS041_07725 [Planomonospora sp. ID67723]|uniref:hypothetical protein n=1 Tax=Planomonospora sp. ID67723 TaxID=2738134 RepID=UPI0018C36F09|nr:hypothetical protein [Planomonospora sp. ID67723]MBG0827650.1 hypothetical protein [Planomonospora sp. ID67723]